MKGGRREGKEKDGVKKQKKKRKAEGQQACREKDAEERVTKQKKKRKAEGGQACRERHIRENRKAEGKKVYTDTKERAKKETMDRFKAEETTE